MLKQQLRIRIAINYNYLTIIFGWHSFLKSSFQTQHMNNIFRGLIAGYGAKKLGGGCFSTILIFIVIWYALGHCN